MYDSLLMQCSNPRNNLFKILNGFIDCNLKLFSLQKKLEMSTYISTYITITQFKYHICLIHRFNIFVHPNHILILDLQEGIFFITNQIPYYTPILIEDLLFQTLNRITLPFLILSQVYLHIRIGYHSIITTTYFILKSIIPQLLTRWIEWQSLILH
jgi:hypothetical protein